MEIKFALNISQGLGEFKNVIGEFENIINASIFGRHYGDDLFQIYIGWICVTPDFDPFFKPRKPKYYTNKHKVVDGHNYNLVKALEFEIKLDYNVISEAVREEMKIVLVNVLIASLTTIIKQTKKIVDFNLEYLVKDIMAGLLA